MSSNTNADQWFESYPLTMDIWRQGTAPYRVIRHNGTDYAYAQGVFRFISSSDDYHFLSSAGFIRVPHGTAPTCALNLLEYIRNEAGRWAAPGVPMDGIVNALPMNARVADFTETADVTRAACEHCRAEDAA